MEVRKGYQETEVGVIPIDWEVKELGSCLVKNPDYGINAAAVPYKEHLPVYLRITDISEDGKFLSQDKVSVDHSMSGYFFLDTGDIVFARTGASVGKTYLYNNEDGKLVFAGFLIRVRVNPRVLLPLLLKYNTQTKNYWNWVVTNSMRSGQPGLNSNEFKSLKIPLPPTLEEQTAIATALSETDALITNLEKLIAKKRYIKQGAMQELLKPKKGWEVKRLGEIGKFTKGLGIRKDESQSGALPCVRYGELYTRHNDYIRRFYSFISKEISLTSKKVKKGDILFAGSGETKKEIGKCAAFIDEIEAYAGGDIVIMSPEGHSSLFLGFLLNTPLVQNQKASRGQGDAVVHISARQLENITVSIPSHEEQNRIASVFVDMDSEISSLESKLEKYRQIKSGMMQNLLTGKIRLV